MEQQKNFSTTAFGGFKKEEVLEYINIINNKHEEDLVDIKQELEQTKAQLAEFKTIVEEQYSKIVDATEQSEASLEKLKSVLVEKQELADKIESLSTQNTELEDELRASVREKIENEQVTNELKEKLKVYLDAKENANDIVLKAEKEAQSLADDMKRRLSEAASQVKIMVNQASNRSTGLLEPAKVEAEKIITDAKATADEIIEQAKNQSQSLLDDAKIQIENTISLNEENEERARRLVDAARREAEEIVKRSNLSVSEGKNHYESCLKALESQKAKLLTTLDEIKNEVVSLKIGQPQKPDRELVNSLRESTSEAIRKKFTMMNKERGSGRPRI